MEAVRDLDALSGQETSGTGTHEAPRGAITTMSLWSRNTPLGPAEQMKRHKSKIPDRSRCPASFEVLESSLVDREPRKGRPIPPEINDHDVD